jgi:hypothetical protein
MAIAKTVPQQDDDVDEDEKISVEGRRECVAALEVRSSSSFPLPYISFLGSVG